MLIEDNYEEICEEIEQLVDEGVLNEFHLKYYENPYYQVPYIKFKNANLLETKLSPAGFIVIVAVPAFLFDA